MNMHTKDGEMISFAHRSGRTIMTVTGAAEEGTRAELVELNMTLDDLMELQNEVYIAIHGRPDPEVDAQKADDERIKRLVKEAFAEIVGGPAPLQPSTFVQNISVPSATDLLSGMIADFLYGKSDHSKQPRPKRSI